LVIESEVWRDDRNCGSMAFRGNYIFFATTILPQIRPGSGQKMPLSDYRA
jgi:hypothetical protein